MQTRDGSGFTVKAFKPLSIAMIDEPAQHLEFHNALPGHLLGRDVPCDSLHLRLEQLPDTDEVHWCLLPALLERREKFGDRVEL